MCVFSGECFYGWLEPLLARLVQEPTTVVSPSIAVINKNDLQFIKPVMLARTHTRGNFDWMLSFGWETIPEEERVKRNDETYPVRQMIYKFTQRHLSHNTFDFKLHLYCCCVWDTSFHVVSFSIQDTHYCRWDFCHLQAVLWTHWNLWWPNGVLGSREHRNVI